MVDFDKLNRETMEYRNKCVDRFNPSTRGNYSTPNLAKLNAETYCHNNGMSLSDYYNRTWKNW